MTKQNSRSSRRYSGNGGRGRGSPAREETNKRKVRTTPSKTKGKGAVVEEQSPSQVHSSKKQTKDADKEEDLMTGVIATTEGTEEETVVRKNLEGLFEASKEVEVTSSDAGPK